MCATSKKVMETKILAVFVLSCISSSVHAVTLTGCPAGNITDGSQTSLRCSGLFRSFNYSWAITTPSTGGPEKVLAACSSVSLCVITDTAYNITRVSSGMGSDLSFARFVINITVHSNAIVRCFLSTDTAGGGEQCTLLNIIAATTTLAPTTTTTTTTLAPTTTTTTTTLAPSTTTTTTTLAPTTTTTTTTLAPTTTTTTTTLAPTTTTTTTTLAPTTTTTLQTTAISTTTTTTTPTTTTILSTTTTTTTPPVQSTAATKRISLTTSFDGEQDGSPIELQRGQEAFLLTCRYDNTTGSAGHVSWCLTGECPEGSSICSTRNRTCPEHFGQEVVTQSCEGSEPCGVTLTIKQVSECDGGTYSCYVFSSVNARKYDVASVTVSVKDCEKNAYGPTCSDTCGRCAGNQRCNTSTGLCLACVAGWIPPLCTTAVPPNPLLTPHEKIAVGVAAGGSLSWAFIATLVQVCQILGNAGWLPFLSLRGKGDKKEEEGNDAEESAVEEKPPSKCSRFLKCIFCGGAGMCLLSFLFCISCGKLLSNKFRWRTKEDIQDDAGGTDGQGQEAPPAENSQGSADSVYIHDIPEGEPASSNDSTGSVVDPDQTATSTEKYPYIELLWTI